MKFIHLSDLHIGKRVNEYSMIDDQKHILASILDIIDEKNIEAVIIAGDIYDKSIPPAEAVELFDSFITKLSLRSLPTFIISGNHDSAERLSFGARVMQHKKIFISPVYRGDLSSLTINDEHGEINVYLLPFIKPAHVKHYFPEEEVSSYTDALRVAISKAEADFSKRNILLCHQFVTGANRTESEEISIGGSDNVDVSVFDGFDYVAMGHIHRAQRCSYEHVRYSGTPLKYSFSESRDKKTVTIVDFGKKGDISYEFEELKPLHDMIELRGSYAELMKKDFYEGTSYRDDYVHITLTDEEDIPDAIGRLRVVYKNLMRLDYDNIRTKTNARLDTACAVEEKSPIELFSELYQKQNNTEMSENQLDFLKELIGKVCEEDK